MMPCLMSLDCYLKPTCHPNCDIEKLYPSYPYNIPFIIDILEPESSYLGCTGWRLSVRILFDLFMQWSFSKDKPAEGVSCSSFIHFLDFFWWPWSFLPWDSSPWKTTIRRCMFWNHWRSRSAWWIIIWCNEECCIYESKAHSYILGFPLHPEIVAPGFSHCKGISGNLYLPLEVWDGWHLQVCLSHASAISVFRMK